MNLREIATCAVRNREGLYWHDEGTVDAMVKAAEAVEHLGTEAIIDAMELEIKKHEFICDFDDPCDAWGYFARSLVACHG